MDALGDRMKEYEAAFAGKAMPFLPILARIDGKCFHSLAKRMGFLKPFDMRLHQAFVATAIKLVEETNATIGYTQSDEITLAWYTDNPGTQLFFDGKVQKLISVLASQATLEFNVLASRAFGAEFRALFDCRVWQVPTLVEATNVFVWREIDATKNSISMAARAHYSHKQVHGMSSVQMQDMLHAKGVNWNDYPAEFKRGSYIRRDRVWVTLDPSELSKIPQAHRPEPGTLVERNVVSRFDLPPIRTIPNRVEVLFHGADPVVA